MKELSRPGSRRVPEAVLGKAQRKRELDLRNSKNRVPCDWRWRVRRRAAQVLPAPSRVHLSSRVGLSGLGASVEGVDEKVVWKTSQGKYQG